MKCHQADQCFHRRIIEQEIEIKGWKVYVLDKIPSYLGEKM